MEEFSEQDNDRISRVSKVRRGIYVMQQTTDDQPLFRFGAIGVKGKNNNALRRLTQIDEGRTNWHYVKVIRFDNNYSCERIKDHENKLRNEFKKIEKFQWIGKKDRFKAVDVGDSAAAKKLVSEVFDRFVATNLSQLNNSPK